MAEVISRNDAGALIPDEISKDIIQGVQQGSVVLSMFHKLPNLTGNVRQMPVLKLLPTAGFVNGETGLKPTTKAMWDKKYIYAEEIAVIVPISENVLDDAENNGYDIWAELKPLIVQSFGQVIDSAVIFGKDAPASWRKCLVDTIKEKGYTVSETGDLVLDLLGEDGIFGKVEESGFEVSGCLSGIRFKSKLRTLRDDNGQPIFKKDLQSGTQYSLDGAPLNFSRNGTWENNNVKVIAGDFTQAVYAIRQDITYKLLTEGVISDSEGKVIYNLAQQDMVALRCVMRLGWELPNPINAEQPDEEKRLPFAALVPGEGNANSGAEQPNEEKGAGEDANNDGGEVDDNDGGDGN